MVAQRVVRPSLWQTCLKQLEGELTTQQFSTWIRPLHAVENGPVLQLLAPNRFVQEWIREHFFEAIESTVARVSAGVISELRIDIGSRKLAAGTETPPKVTMSSVPRTTTESVRESVSVLPSPTTHSLNTEFTFSSFIEGKSNQLARAASFQVAQQPGLAYNPLFIYGGVGLGKTHLMHAIGNQILLDNPDARVVYLHSERFVADMVKSLQHNSIEDFKRYYRSLNALLIDDIQFFAGKERSQEEFFHTFNSLMEGQQQIIMTCDRYPKEIAGLEERLKSRFGWGLTVPIEPPELETRVAILKSKAHAVAIPLPDEVAFFIAKRIRSNVRELEGALRRVIANARFTSQPITLDFAKDALQDLINLQDKLVTIENIQKTVAEYYKMRVTDLLSQRRSRSVARPRQLAMLLAKELTRHSLPEIGDAFGGRDHTTVIHACKKIIELKESDHVLSQDYANLVRTLGN